MEKAKFILQISIPIILLCVGAYILYLFLIDPIAQHYKARLEALEEKTQKVQALYDDLIKKNQEAQNTHDTVIRDINNRNRVKANYYANHPDDFVRDTLQYINE